MAKISMTMMMIVGLVGGIAAGCATEVGEPDVETSTTQQQLPSQSCTTFFFSDASMTTFVGTCTTFCSGERICDGTRTSFAISECFFC